VRPDTVRDQSTARPTTYWKNFFPPSRSRSRLPYNLRREFGKSATYGGVAES